MANILDRYGIKEVADVTFYEIGTDGNPGAPVLYLDTLKVSTIEQTAENAEARGGKGNPALISWDYGKEITVTLEDALYSAKSLALMFGDVDANSLPAVSSETDVPLKRTVRVEELKDGKVEVNGTTITLNEVAYYDASGKKLESETGAVYATGTFTPNHAMTIDVSANTFPGTYYITGDTYARSETTGKDDFFQFIIPKAKVLSESNTLTLEAEGDPTVFSMSLKVLKAKGQPMMKLVQYDFVADGE